MQTRRALTAGVLATGLALALLSGACAQQDDGGEATTIGVTLQEWSVIPDESSAPAGEIGFEVSNAGEDDHEFMVVRTELGLTALPSKKDGSFDEDGDDIEIVDATNAAAHGGDDHETVEPGEAKTFEYDLDEGSYVLMCNLVDEEDDEKEVHFKLGMRIPFEVS